MCFYLSLHTTTFLKITVCFSKGECSCVKSEITVYAKPNKSQALVRWPEPDLQCATFSVNETIVNPPVKSPSYFSPGKHVITYTYKSYKLKGDVIATCPVTINVIGELIQTYPFYRHLSNTDISLIQTYPLYRHLPNTDISVFNTDISLIKRHLSNTDIPLIQTSLQYRHLSNTDISPTQTSLQYRHL